jgi:hypothetical protein
VFAVRVAVVIDPARKKVIHSSTTESSDSNAGSLRSIERKSVPFYESYYLLSYMRVLMN